MKGSLPRPTPKISTTGDVDEARDEDSSDMRGVLIRGNLPAAAYLRIDGLPCDYRYRANRTEGLTIVMHSISNKKGSPL